jgi:tetratricopeptide (TPR) repeat protein
LEPPQRDLAEAHAHYATAVIHDLNGQLDLALEEYSQAALKDPANETLILEVSRRFLLANQVEKAVQILTCATATPQATSALYARLGLAYSRLGKTDLAIKANRNAILKDPQALAAYQNLFVGYLQDRRDSEALGVLDEAAAVPQTSAEFLIGLSELYANFGLQIPGQRRVANLRALALLERAEGLGVKDPGLRLKLADGFNLLGQDEKAAQIYVELLNHLSDAPFWHENIRAKLADIYLRGPDRKLAVDQLRAVLRDNPTDSQSYYLLGSLCYEQKNYVEAADCFAKVVLLNPGREPVYYDLAWMQLMEAKSREALETLAKARQKFRPGFRLEYLSALAYSGQESFANAVACFNAAEILAQPADTNLLDEKFYFQFGAASERLGDFAQAERHFEKCLSLAPDFAAALNYLGYMWAERGENLERARGLIERALKVEPQNPAYLDSMGWVLFRLQQPREALDYLLEAVGLSPEPDATLYDHLGDIHAALGQPEAAQAAWRKSFALEPNDRVRRKLEPGAGP